VHKSTKTPVVKLEAEREGDKSVGEDDLAMSSESDDISDTEGMNDDVVHQAFRKVLESDDPHRAMRVNFRELPKRFLSPGKKVHIYWQYVSLCHTNGDVPASWPHFKKVWRKYFSSLIGFREKNEHAKCSSCEGYKTELRHAENVSVRLQVAARYAEHMNNQFCDRQVYWNARHMSRLCLHNMLQSSDLAEGSIHRSQMTIILDGMDQSKFRIPHLLHQTKTKDSELLIRPPLHVVGTWIHGAGVFLCAAEPDCPKDSNQNQECLGRALNEFYAAAGSLPRNITIQVGTLKLREC
jgi:hypothetical protein